MIFVVTTTEGMVKSETSVDFRGQKTSVKGVFDHKLIMIEHIEVDLGQQLPRVTFLENSLNTLGNWGS